jgi:hypothetical protein
VGFRHVAGVVSLDVSVVAGRLKGAVEGESLYE